jgi:hypothetical protein
MIARRGRRAAGWGRADRAWERLQEEGNARLAAGDAAGAARLFRRAGWVAALGFRRSDPRRATTLANLALADRLAGREARARRRYARARAAWQGAEDFIATMRIARRSRSAAIGQRMVAGHEETYHQNMRIRMTSFARATSAALAALEAGAPVTVRLAGRWAAEKPPVFDDTRRFLAAALLVAVAPAGAAAAGTPKPAAARNGKPG